MKKKLYILNLNIKPNNILCSLTDLKGNVLWWVNKGTFQNKSSKRTTPLLVHSMLNKLKYNKNDFYVLIKGFNRHRLLLLKTIQNLGVKILFIEYLWKIPYNGCKKKKRRRL